MRNLLEERRSMRIFVFKLPRLLAGMLAGGGEEWKSDLKTK